MPNVKCKKYLMQFEMNRKNTQKFYLGIDISTHDEKKMNWSNRHNFIFSSHLSN